MEQITLRAARINKNLKQTEFAKLLNVDRRTVSSWETGKTMPSLDKIDPICEILGVSYDNIKWKVSVKA